MSSYRYFTVVLFLAFILFTSAVSADTDIRIAEADGDVQNDYTSYSYSPFGPFILLEDDTNVKRRALRPIFYSFTDRKAEHREMDILWPIFAYRDKRNMRSVQMLLYLISYRQQPGREGDLESEFTLFPFIFYRSADEQSGSHFGMFPLYGNLTNKFHKDEIKFVMFPLYLRTTSGENITTSYLWPFISVYSGDQEGFRFWPLWGKRTRESDNLEESFLLWPFYVSRDREVHGQRFYSRSFFPFYSEAEFFGLEHRSYMWPLYSRTSHIDRDIERWDVPWPLVNITRGERHQTRIFPFYSRKQMDRQDEEGFILWPLYRYSKYHMEDHIRKRRSILLFLYRDITYEPATQTGRSGKRVDMWPLFSYERDRDDTAHFHIFTIFEPFVRSSERLYRNYSAFWRLFEWRRMDEETTETSLLWDFMYLKKGEEHTVFEIKPIIPVISYNSGGEGRSFKLLGGALGFSGTESSSILHLLYYPFKFGNNTVSNENHLRGNEHWIE